MTCLNTKILTLFLERRRLVLVATGLVIAFLCFTAVSFSSTRSSSYSTSTQTPPLVIKGYKWFDSSSGEEVVIRGMDYYPRPNQGLYNYNSVDFYTEEQRHIWERDIPHLQALGVNAIRLYAVDYSQNHDAFMNSLQKVGIYVIVALAHDCPTCAVTRESSPDCYPPELKTQGQEVIRAFAKYPNTLAFSAGNEVNHFTPVGVGDEWNAPCQKKFLRDMRAYMGSCVAGSSSLRSIPIGLVSADDERENLATYYNCQDDDDDSANADPYERAEWYGLNTYVFCNGKAHNFSAAAGFQLLDKDFESYRYSIPVLLTEFGCLSESFPTVHGYEGQRTFDQAKWMLQDPKLRSHFAGGFAFEYSVEWANAHGDSAFPFTTFGHQNYGVGVLEPEECDDVNISCTYQPLPSFEALQRAYGVPIVGVTNMDDFEPEPDRQKPSKCPPHYPPLNSFNWTAVDQTPSLQCPKSGTNYLETFAFILLITGVVSALALLMTMVWRKSYFNDMHAALSLSSSSSSLVGIKSPLSPASNPITESSSSMSIVSEGEMAGLLSMTEHHATRMGDGDAYGSTSGEDRFAA